MYIQSFMENEKPQTEQTEQVQKPEEALSLVQQAEAAAGSIKEQVDRYEALVKRNEEATTKTMLGGGTNSGQNRLTPEEEEKAKIQKGADEIIKAFK